MLLGRGRGIHHQRSHDEGIMPGRAVIYVHKSSQGLLRLASR
jgi:hypothetical protein